jgi:SAM-dependent methyltransferase
VNNISAADFEARYRADPDPWDYTGSDYERQKYAATLDACGDGPFARALELGGSIGVFSALLAPRCDRLMTIDVAPTAVRQARDRLAGHPHATAIVGSIPSDVPAGPYDLIVASEILYYLSDDQLAGTLTMLERELTVGGSLVAVHWRPPGPERPRDAAQAHAALRRLPVISQARSASTDDYLLEVFRR